MRNKCNDLETLARGLDISPSMHHETVQRYGAISEYINTHGIDAFFIHKVHFVRALSFVPSKMVSKAILTLT